ncbi:MAG: shikimate kinase [Clostridia bacterium]|nr:shikimate kinase [Clostridia bacterium]
MHNNIILIGMPGCGKSTVGVLLAKTLLKSFCDTDLLIQEREGTELYKIIAQVGADRFSQIENEVVSGLKCKNTVVATGGSVVFGKEAMEILKSQGTVVYLKLPYPTIKRRLYNIKTRGVVMAPGQTLKNIYDQRTPLYEKYADVTVDCSNSTLEKTVERVVDALKG